MKIYCFGNEYVKEDSQAKELADELEIEGVEFIKCNSPEDLLDEKERIVILDVVKGIDKIQLLNIDQLKARNIVSLHDFDLNFFLKLMKSIGKINDITIIGIPMDNVNKEQLKETIRKLI
jgi:Ni,Fe-hydrogenase maturation factor